MRSFNKFEMSNAGYFFEHVYIYIYRNISKQTSIQSINQTNKDENNINKRKM